MYVCMYMRTYALMLHICSVQSTKGAKRLVIIIYYACMHMLFLCYVSLCVYAPPPQKSFVCKYIKTIQTLLEKLMCDAVKKLDFLEKKKVMISSRSERKKSTLERC